MNKTNLLSLLAVVIACLGIMLTGCNKASDIDAVACQDDIVIIKTNLKSFLVNADCTIGKDGIDYSGALGKLMRNDRDAKEFFDKLSEVKGVDWENQLITIDKNGNAVVALALTNPKAFCQSWVDITVWDREEEDGYILMYEDDDDTDGFIVKGNVAYYVNFNNGKKISPSNFEKLLDKAKNKPLEDWQKSALSKNKTFTALLNVQAVSDMLEEEEGFSLINNPLLTNMYSDGDIRKSWCCIEGNFEGPKFAVESYLFSQDGRQIKSKLDNKALNTDMLKYCVNQAQFVFMTSVPQKMDWDEYFQTIAETFGGRYNADEFEPIIKVMEMFKGSVLVSFRLKNNELDEIPNFSAAAEMSKADANKLLDDMEGLLKQIQESNSYSYDWQYNEYGYLEYMPVKNAVAPKCYERQGDKITIDMDYLMGKSESNGNVAIAQVVPEGLCISFGDMSEASKLVSECRDKSFIVIWANPKNVRLGDVKLPFGFATELYTKDDKAVLSVELSDNDGKILDRVLTFIAGQM